MIRAVPDPPRMGHEDNLRGPWGERHFAQARFLALAIVAGLVAGCAIVPSSRMDECQRSTQTLRSENARMKDRVLAPQGQNRDYAERAVDDAKRLAIQDEAIERLETSVQAYQDERTRLEAAYQQLASSVAAGDVAAQRRPTQPAAKAAPSEDPQPPATARVSQTLSRESGAAAPR